MKKEGKKQGLGAMLHRILSGEEPAGARQSSEEGDSAQKARPCSRPAVAVSVAVREAPAPAQTKKRVSRKRMLAFLCEYLRECAAAEEELIGAAVQHFDAHGEQHNGIKGLVSQILHEKDSPFDATEDGTFRVRAAAEQPAAGENGPEAGSAAQSAAPARRDRQKSQRDKQPAAAADKQPKTQARSQSQPLPQTRTASQPRAEKPAVAVAEKTVVRATQVREVQRRAPARDRQLHGHEELNENLFARQFSGGGALFNQFVARLLEAYYRRRGDRLNGRYIVDGSEDRGVDVVLMVTDAFGVADVVCIQAKTRTTGQITLKEVREFLGVLSAEGGTRGVYVTNSTFTTDAVAFIRKNPKLGAIDKHALFELSRELGVGVSENEDGRLVLHDLLSEQ